MRTHTGKTKIAGVVGWPIDHSLSPRLHGFWLDHYAIDGVYLPFPTHPDRLIDALRGLPALGVRGVNITLPHKERALAAMDKLTPTAQRIGAVNTVIVEENGELRGDNTDAQGFIDHLKATAHHWRAKGEKCLVLGAGGAARAVIVALLEGGVDEIRLINRTRRRAEEMALSLGGPIKVCDWEERDRQIADIGLLVNTTRLGMKGQPPLEIDLSSLPKKAIVNDIVYVPLETPLLAQAKKRGNKTIDGLGMLLHQARPGFEAWFGTKPDVTLELRAFMLEQTP